MLFHLKKRLGVLAVIAVMSALVPALTTSVASAVPQTALAATAALDTTALSACPASASIAAAGFTDTTSTDVDCIAYYGITTGVTSTTYEPSANIPRWQMALYLTRFMDVTGSTLGSGADQGFTDISGYSAAIQTAINQIKQAGVTTGKTATTYDPDSNVTREEMTMFITRALASTTAGYRGSADTALTPTKINGSTATYNYDDVDTGVTFEGHNTIVEAYNLGLTGHLSTVRTFSPAADITRADMATWLTNALAHTTARPEGLHVQSTDVADFGSMGGADDELVISHRDASFDAIANTSVDVMAFYDNPADTTDLATTAAGKCDDMVTAQSSTLCTMDVGDSVTNAAGNIVLEMASMTDGDADVDDGETVQYWAWTAANGTIYDSDVNTTSTVTIVSTTDATQLKVTSSQPKATRSATPEGIVADINLDGVTDNATEVNFNEARYGTTVTLTFQLYDSATTNAKVAKALDLITVTDAYGVTPGTQPTSVTTTKIYTGADGSVEYDVVCGADPVAGVDATESYRRITWVSASGETIVNLGTADAVAEEFFFCTDETPAASTSTLSIADKYKTVTAATALAPVTSTVTGTVYDQFGNVVANQAVAFDSDMTANDAADAVEGLLDGTKRTTNASGQASASISVTGVLTGMETITFCVDDAANGCLVGSDTAEKTANIFWVTANAGTSDTGGAVYSVAGANLELVVMVVDAPNDIMVVRGSSSAVLNTYTTVPYDANDQFSDRTDAGATLVPISMSDFETKAAAASCTVLTGYECSTPWDWAWTNIDYNAVSVAGTGGVSIINTP
jgi:hypothetical protein